MACDGGRAVTPGLGLAKGVNDALCVFLMSGRGVQTFVEDADLVWMDKGLTREAQLAPLEGGCILGVKSKTAIPTRSGSTSDAPWDV